MSAEARVAELNLEFPTAPKPGGVYHPVVIVGDLAHVSGHGPMRTDGTMITGKVGATMNEADAYLILLDPKGNVAWLHTGALNDNSYRELSEQVRKLVPAP